MKKLIILVLTLLVATGNLAMAQSGPEVPEFTAPTTSSTLATETINNINVPYTILLDAQMVFQGFAVTEAKQYRRGSQEVYALRMDNSDTNRSSESFYLLFSMDWQYIGREQAPPPPPAPKPEEPKPEEKPDEDRGSERPEEAPQQETEEQVEEANEGSDEASDEATESDTEPSTRTLRD